MNKSLRNLESSWQLVRENNILGSRELLLTALDALNIYLESTPDNRQEVQTNRQLLEQLGSIRPDMMAFSNISRYLLEVDNEKLLEEIVEVKKYLLKAPKTIGTYAISVTEEPQRILVLSRSSIVEEVLYELYDAERLASVCVLESRPQNEGRVLAENLSKRGIKVNYYVDAAMGIAVQTTDTVFVGADAVCIEGTFLGKIGCYPLASIAREHNIPFNVLTDTFKISYAIPDIATANKRCTEDDLKWKDLNNYINLRNYYFEQVPSELVSRYITERGIENPPLLPFSKLSY